MCPRMEGTYADEVAMGPGVAKGDESRNAVSVASRPYKVISQCSETTSLPKDCFVSLVVSVKPRLA